MSALRVCGASAPPLLAAVQLMPGGGSVNPVVELLIAASTDNTSTQAPCVCLHILEDSSEAKQLLRPESLVHEDFVVL